MNFLFRLIWKFLIFHSSELWAWRSCSISSIVAKPISKNHFSDILDLKDQVTNWFFHFYPKFVFIPSMCTTKTKLSKWKFCQHYGLLSGSYSRSVPRTTYSWLLPQAFLPSNLNVRPDSRASNSRLFKQEEAREKLKCLQIEGSFC